MRRIRELLRGENTWDFRPAWRRAVVVSIVLVAVSIGSLVIRGLNLGIDFEGGVSWEVKAPGVTVEQAREVLAPLGEAGAKVQVVGTDTLRVQAIAGDAGKEQAVSSALAVLAGVPVTEVGVSTVGPSWGSEVTTTAVRALVVFFLAVLLYLTLTLELRMAVGAIIAVVHDIIISVGVYSVFQFEVTPATVIAFLTILGFSIYDTVVVYDKVQENQHRVGLANRMTYGRMMSLSMNQVLLRSLNTSALAVLPVLAMLVVGSFILGAVTLQEFSVALTVGMFVGVYSSIFIAAPAVVYIKEREPKYRKIKERIEGQEAEEAAAEEVPAGAGPTEGTEAPADDGGAPEAGARPAAARRTPVVTSGAIPPRPRKKSGGKRR